MFTRWHGNFARVGGVHATRMAFHDGRGADRRSLLRSHGWQSKRHLTLGGTSADQLAFTVQPQNAVARQIITPAVQVTALDPLGNTDVSFTGQVTVSLGTNPGGGFLGGTLTVGAVNGVASFGDLTVSSAGTGYTLLAATSGAKSATSNPFNITSP